MKRILTLCLALITYFVNAQQINENQLLELKKLDSTLCTICPIWDFIKPISALEGLIINSNGDVTSIVLPFKGLSGNLIKLNLPFLKSLDLQNNSIEIVGDLNLPNLETLRLNNNKIREISNFSKMPKLKELFLEKNLLEVVPDFSGLPELEYLWIYDNKLKEVPNFTNLKNVEFLYLHNNPLERIPDFNIQTLRYLDLSDLGISGKIPDFDLPELIYLDLSGNKFYDEIPSFEKLSVLQHLKLANNFLYGEIPDFDLPNLSTLDISSNILSGGVPRFLKLRNLRTLDISKNNLTGWIPVFTNSPNLKNINVNGNKFSFEDIKDHFGFIQIYDDKEYSSQYHGENQVLHINENTSLTLQLSEPLRVAHPNATYQWKKNDVNIEGATSPSLELNNLSSFDIGEYTVHIRDENFFADLEIISKPINVLLKGYGPYGNEVAEGEIIYEFETEQDFLDFVEVHQSLNIVDQCNCNNRFLYLIKHETDSIAKTIKLETQEVKVETAKETSQIDDSDSNYLLDDQLFLNDGAVYEYNISPPTPSSNHVSIAMEDTGIDENMTYNESSIFDIDADVCETIKNKPLVAKTQDDNGHGSLGFRFIVDNNNGLNLDVLPLKVFNKEGNGTLFDLICGLYYAVDQKVNVVNISAGYSGARSEILEEAIKYAMVNGIFVVTAAGNSARDNDVTPYYPSSFSIEYPNVISVASIDHNNELSYFSNKGIKSVTLSAQGQSMGGMGLNDEFQVGNGTSFSAYFVSAMLAREITKSASKRSIEDIWSDFQNNFLTADLMPVQITKTGKRLDLESVDISSDHCYAPIRVLIDSINCTSTTLQWDSLSSSSSYAIEWRVMNGMWSEPLSSLESNTNLSDLMPNTMYEVRVKSICTEVENNNESGYSPIFSFITLEDCITNCEAAFIANINSVTCSSAIIGLDNANEISNNAEFRAVGGTWNSITSVFNNFELLDLDEQSAYEVRVKSTCNNGFESEYSPVFTFSTTICDCEIEAIQVISLSKSTLNDEFTDAKRGKNNLNQITSYPNPVNDILHLNLDGLMNNVQIKIKSIEGKIVYQSELYLDSSHNIYELDMSNLAIGMHVLNIYNEDIVFATKIEIIR